MTPLEILKSMLPLYHMRNKIDCTTLVDEYLCTVGGNKLTVYHNNYRDHGRLMEVSDIHRTKFNNVCIRFYSSDISKGFTVLKKNNHSVLFSAGDNLWNKAQLIDTNVERDMFFNLSMEFNISLSYEELQELGKLCSQINHDIAFYLR